MNDPKKLGIDLGTSDDACVFVVGPPRSGTTMIRLVLNEHPELCIPAETWIFPKLIRRAKLYGDFSSDHHYEAFAQHACIAKAETMRPFGEVFKINEKQVISSLKKFDAHNYAQAYAAVMSELARRKKKSRWGDKSTFYSAYLPILADAYPNAKFIGLIRDPRDVTNSLHNTSWGKETYGTILDAAMRTRYGVESLEASQKKLGSRLHLLRYEDFVSDPEAQTKTLCDFADLSYDPAMLNFHQHSKKHVPKGARDWQQSTTAPINTERISQWKEHITGHDLLLLETATAGFMKRWNYKRETSSSPTTLLSLKKWQARQLLRRDPFHWTQLMKP